MKVYVYAIAKNESKFVSRWAKWTKEADGAFVLDTGSTDDTVSLLKNEGVTVKEEKISPWRFDEARNRSLALLPKDAQICVSADLDEVFDDGWRAEIEKAFISGANLCSVRYVWSTDENGKEGVVFFTRKAHLFGSFLWRGIVHETIEPIPGASVTEAKVTGVSLRHYPDLNKSRAQYLPMLEQANLENPSDDRVAHYLGREYFFHNQCDKAIDAFEKHLRLPTAVWKEERCASMRYLAECYLIKGDEQSALAWLLRAVAEYPHSREPWVALGKLAYSTCDYDCAVWALTKATKISSPSPSYINDPVCFSALPYDLLSLSYYYTGRLDLALASSLKAVELEPNQARLVENERFFRQALSKAEKP